MTSRAHTLDTTYHTAPDFQNFHAQDGRLNGYQTRSEEVKFPAIALEKVKQQRLEHQTLLKTLFPHPVRLHRLLHDIEKNFATEIASIIGSVDFAPQRLAGLLSAVREIIQTIETQRDISLAELREHIQSDPRIHEIFEDLIFDCAQFSTQEAGS